MTQKTRLINSQHAYRETYFHGASNLLSYTFPFQLKAADTALNSLFSPLCLTVHREILVQRDRY
jgi:hypothetical protein